MPENAQTDAQNMPEKEIDVLLAEYQAAHMNRDNYHSVAWTMGSIFIVGSVTSFSISFTWPIVYNRWHVMAISTFSIVLFVIWLAYVEYLQRLINWSFSRMWDIEKELMSSGLDIRLHTTIKQRSKEKRLRGRYVTRILAITVVLAWIGRVILVLLDV